MRFHPLLIAMLTVFSYTSMQASADDVDVSQSIDDVFGDIESVQVADSGLVDEMLFLECAQIASDVGRLACYDELAQHKTPSALNTKRSIALGSTIKSTLTGHPQWVYDRTQSAPSSASDATNTHTVAATEIPAQYTPLSLAFDLDKNSEKGLWSSRPHNATYILPLYYNANPNRDPSTPTQATLHYSDNDMRNTELKFQFSLKAKVAQNLFGTEADLWAGYTQQSHWQVYNEDNSRPFRAHDYEPEVFLTQPVSANLPFGGRLRMLGAGGVHHSNGQSDPLSRSWNRLYLMGGAEWGKLTVVPRIWTRIKADQGSKPDDNPDILDYYGYGDVKFIYQRDNGTNISGLVRFNPKTSKGAVQLDYVYPLHRGISGYVQLFHGYGESLIDYNHETTTVGVGVMLNDWMGL